tara:strand:+ start:1840 stop:2841 length:1002 start_codon:yes stop_codon:yes gene_type:complete
VAIPDPSINVQTQGGDSAFENIFVFGQLNYDFDRDDLKIRSIDVTSESAFAKDVTFSGSINVSGSGTFIGDLNVDELTARNANVTGIVTTSGDFYALGRFRDVNSNPGSAGQILSSTGNGVDWIDADTTSVANSVNVGVNLDSTNADQFVSFFGANNGNNPNRVDNDFTYNPSTNTLKVGNIVDSSGNASAFVTGMIILWYGNTGNIPGGWVLCDGNNSTPDLRDRFVIGAGSADHTPGSTGGSNSITLSEANLPSHRHFVVSNDLGGQNRTNSNVSANNQVRKGTGAGNLYESYNLASTGSDAASGRSSAVGSGTAINNKPLYHALCYIMKT